MKLFAPSIQHTKNQFYTLEEMATFKPGIRNTFLLRWLLLKDVQIQNLSEYLALLGFHRFSFYKAGTEAIILKSVDGQLVRLALNKGNGKRLEHRAILEPIHSHVIGRGDYAIKVEVFPAVYTRNIGKSEIKHLKQAFQKSGVIANDIETEGNVGRLPCGKLVALDAEHFEKDTLISFDPNHPCLTEGGWIRSDGMWAQRHDFLSLRTKQLTGNMPSVNLEKLVKTRGEDSTIVKAFRQGYYIPEVGQI